MRREKTDCDFITLLNASCWDVTRHQPEPSTSPQGKPDSVKQRFLSLSAFLLRPA